MSIEPAKTGSRTVYARIGIWYNEKQRMIHVTIPGSGWFHTTVSDNPASKRYHPNMFRKLKRVLEEQGRWSGDTMDDETGHHVEDPPELDR